VRVFESVSTLIVWVAVLGSPNFFWFRSLRVVVVVVVAAPMCLSRPTEIAF
jgi:hypothetical protein